jgi:hypothetical protein
VSAEALYNAIKSGSVSLDSLNEDGKNALRGYMTGKEQPSIDSIQSDQRQQEQSVGFSPQPFNNDPVQPEQPSAWKGILDNPIVHGAEAGAKAVYDYGLVKPFESLSTGIADTTGALNNLFGSQKRMDYNGNEFTSTPSQSRNLVSDVKNIFSQPNEHISSEAWKGAEPNLGPLKGTSANWTDVLDFAAQSIGPEKFVKPLMELKGLSASDTFDNMFSRFKPSEAAPIEQAQPILGLPEPRSAQRLRDAQQSSVLEPNTSPIYGQGDVQTLGLPQGNYTQPTRLKVSNPDETLSYVMGKIKPEVMQTIEAPARRDLLIQYVQKNMDIPVDEIHNMPMKQLQDLGQNIQQDLHAKMPQIAARVAAKYGHDLPSLLEGQAPNLRAQIAKDAQSQVYGVPARSVGLQKPNFNVQHVADAAMPETKIKLSDMKGNLSDTKKVTDMPKLSDMRKEVAATRSPNVMNERVLQPKLSVVDSPIPKLSGIRANYKNQLDNGKFSPEAQQKITGTNQTYEKHTNRGAILNANKAVENLPKAEAQFLRNKEGGDDHIAMGYRLMQKLDALGEHERFLAVSNKLAEDLTKSGQTSQAATILSKLSPEAQMLKLVREAKDSGKVVSINDSIEFRKQAKIYQKESGSGIRANQFTEILDRAAKGERLTAEDVKKMSDYLSSVESKATKVVDDLPKEFKEPRKREKIISFLDNAEQSALARIAARKNQLNSLPIGEWADHAIVVSSQIAKGTIKAATHIEDLVKLFGEEIRPFATKIFEKSQNMLKNVSANISEGDMTKANQAFRNISGQAAKEKAVVQEMASHVKQLISDAKQGKLTQEGIQKLRDYSDEIASMTEDAKPRELPTQEQRFLQSVKALSKKIAQVEEEKIPMDQANREVSSLLRQITKLSDEGSPAIAKQPIDNKALSDIAHDVMEKSRPTPKPTTLQEKIVEKYVKQQDKKGEPVSPKDIETLRELAKNVTRLSGDSRIEADIAMQRILNSYQKSNAWDKVQAIRYMSMLFNSGTQLVNAVSGPIMATHGAVVDVFGTMIDIAMHNIKNTPRTTTMYGTNPLRFITDYFKNLIKVGAPAGWHGTNPAGIQNAGEIRGLSFPSLKNPLTFVPSVIERSLGAVAKGTDYATYKTVFDSEIRKKGFLDAINSGIKRSDKTAIKAHVENFVNEPTEEALLDADRIGRNTTFQRTDSTGGKLANHLASAPSVAKPFLGAIVPFVRTPINMASSAVSMTPAGIIKGLFQLTSHSKASQREAIRTLSMGLGGTFGTSALGYYLSSIGVITGSNDSGDKNVDAIKEQAGKGKYRFNQSGLMRYLKAMLDGEGSEAAEKAAQYQEGDHAFDYNKFQPIAFPLAIGAGLQENKSKPLLQQLGAAGSDAYGSLFGMSTLKGVQDVFQPQYSGTQGEKSIGVASRIAESFFKSFSPSILGQEARREDPIVRKTPYNNGIKEDVMGYFKSRIPGLSQSLPDNKTTLGMNKMNAEGFTGQFVNPYNSQVAAYSSAAAMISDLIDRTGDQSLAPSAPEKKVTGKDKTGLSVSLPIPTERYDQLQEEVGQNIIAKITALPAGLNDLKLADKLKQIYSDINSKERDKVKKELGLH